MDISIPRTVGEVFDDFKGRRLAFIKALTADVAEFFEQCDPENENLCLYGLPNGTWEVNLPAEEVPPELPEPALGINFIRDDMPNKDWLSLVAVRSDSWLLSVAFYFGARFGFNKSDRRRLFEKINDLPTVYEVVYEVVSGNANPSKDQPGSHNNSKSESSGKTLLNDSCKLSNLLSGEPKPVKMPALAKEEDESEEESGDEEDEQDATLCGTCGGIYATGEFWICCDLCERWFHGKCVKITPAKAEHIKQYKCPTCNINKKAYV